MSQYKAPARHALPDERSAGLPRTTPRCPTAGRRPETTDAILEGAAQLRRGAGAPEPERRPGRLPLHNGGHHAQGLKEPTRPSSKAAGKGPVLPTGRVRWPGPAHVLNIFKSEMMGTANWSFTMYPGLSVGCINT